MDIIVEKMIASCCVVFITLIALLLRQGRYIGIANQSSAEYKPRSDDVSYLRLRFMPDKDYADELAKSAIILRNE